MTPYSCPSQAGPPRCLSYPGPGGKTSKGNAKLAWALSHSMAWPGLEPDPNREAAAPKRPSTGSPGPAPARACVQGLAGSPQDFRKLLRVSGSHRARLTLSPRPSVSASSRSCLLKPRFHQLKVIPQHGNQHSLCFAF